MQTQTLALERLTPQLERIRNATFPEYRGRKYSIRVTDKVTFSNLNWSGGTRSQYRACDTEGNLLGKADKYNHVHPWHNPAEGLSMDLPGGVVMVELDCFCGKESIRFHVSPDTFPQNALPAVPDLTWPERVVLVATRSLKSCYAGISNYRYREARRATGITLTDWDSAVESLQAKGMLRKNKSITAAGRNAAGSDQLYQLKQATAGHCAIAWLLALCLTGELFLFGAFVWTWLCK